MRILHVIPDLSPSSGGPVTALIALARAQVELGIEPVIATTGYGEAIHRIPGVLVRSFRCRWDTWRWSPALADFLNRRVRDFDLVSIDGLWRHTNLAAARACRRAGVPYILKTHGMLQAWSLSQKAWKKRPYLHCIEGETIRQAAALHAKTAMEVTESSMPAWNSSVFIVPVGIPCRSVSDPELFVRQFPEIADRQVILFWGRLHRGKRPEMLIKAFHHMHTRHPRTHLVLAGPCESSYEKELLSTVRGLQLSSKVLFTGSVSVELGRAACRAATVFVLPSQQEGFGVAVAEAMAEGCPVVVTEQVGLSPAIALANAGIITAATSEATAASISSLLENERLRIQMGKNGSRLARDQFDSAKVAGKMSEIYSDVIAGTRHSNCWVTEAAGHSSGMDAQVTPMTFLAADIDKPSTLPGHRVREPRLSAEPN